MTATSYYEPCETFTRGEDGVRQLGIELDIEGSKSKIRISGEDAYHVEKDQGEMLYH